MPGNVNIGTISAYIKLETGGLMSGVAAADRALGSFATSGDANLAKIQRRSALVSSAMMVMGGTIAAGLAASTVAAANFNRQMELIHTQAGGTQAQVDKLSKSVLALAPAVGTGPEALSKALYHIVSVGVPAAQQMDVLKIAAEGAKVGMANVEDTTNALASTMVSGIKGISGAAQAMGELNAIVGAGNMRMSDLNSALGTGILAAGRAAGLGINDVGAALATLTDAGMHADQAATRLRMTMTLMAAPSVKAAKSLETIGLSSTQLANDMRQPNGLLIALEDLQSHLKASGKSASEQQLVISRAFGGGRSSVALETLLLNLDRLRTKYEHIDATTNQFGADWAATQKQAAFHTDQLRASMDKLGIETGEVLLPQVNSLVTGLTGLIKSYGDLSDSTRANITIGAELVAGFLLVGGGILKVRGILSGLADMWGTTAAASTAAAATEETATAAIGTGIAGLGGPITLIVAAMGGLVMAWENDWGHIREVTYSAIDDIQNKIDNSSIGSWVNKELGDGGTGMTAEQLSGVGLSNTGPVILHPGLSKSMMQTKVGPGLVPRGRGWDSIVAAARLAGVDERALAAVAAIESGGNPSAKGDYGRYEGGKFIPMKPGTPGGRYTSFGLFQLHEGGQLGSLTPAQALNPQINAQTAAMAFARMGGQGLTGDAAIKGFVGQGRHHPGFENPADYKAEIAAAERVYHHGFGDYIGKGRGAGGAAVPPIRLPKDFNSGSSIAYGGAATMQKGALAQALKAIYDDTHNKRQKAVHDALLQKEKDLANGVSAAVAQRRYELAVAKANEDEYKKDRENEHKYMKAVNEALRKKSKLIISEIQAKASGYKSIQQDVLQAQDISARRNPQKQYAASVHRIMVDMPNGPYNEEYYALRNAKMQEAKATLDSANATLLISRGAQVAADRKQVIDTEILSAGKDLVKAYKAQVDQIMNEMPDAPFPAAYYAKRLAMLNDLAAKNPVADLMSTPAGLAAMATAMPALGNHMAANVGDIIVGGILQNPQTQAGLTSGLTTWHQNIVGDNQKANDAYLAQQRQMAPAAHMAGSIARTISQQLMGSLSQEMQKSFKGPIGRLLSGILSDTIGSALETAIKQAILNSGIEKMIGGLTGGIGGLGGLGLAIGGGLALGGLIGGLFGGGGHSTSQTSASHTINVNFDKVAIHNNQDVQSIGDAVAWHAMNRMGVIGA